jgi:hypothetical protein
MKVILNHRELHALLRQDPDTRTDGGFQSFLVNLGERATNDREIELSEADIEKIQRYAFDYGQGGWEDRLKAIFERHLGPRLGRD